MSWPRANPDRFAVALTFDDALVNQVLAGSDILLMPSIYEPYGITQMYALKYGTVPIVSSVGRLDDSIQSFDGKTGTGFKFALLMTGNHFNKLYKTPWPVFPTSLAEKG